MAKRGKGRPTKYDPSLIKEIDKYLSECGDSVEEFHKTRGVNSDGFERVLSVNLPKIQGFAQYIDVNVDTLNEWAKLYKDFSVALDRITVAQHNALVDGGISGRYSPVITKLLLSANHGMREKTDVTTDGKAINITFDSAFSSKDVPPRKATTDSQ